MASLGKLECSETPTGSRLRGASRSGTGPASSASSGASWPSPTEFDERAAEGSSSDGNSMHKSGRFRMADVYVWGRWNSISIRKSFQDARFTLLSVIAYVASCENESTFHLPSSLSAAQF